MKDNSKHMPTSIMRHLLGFRSLLWIVGFCVVITIIYGILLIWPNLLNSLWLSSDHSWGIFSSIFAHAEFVHLLGNISAFVAGLILFVLVSQADNTKLRSQWSQGLVLMSFIGGIGANLLEYIIGFVRPIGQSWGASGVGYALIGVVLAKSLLSAPNGFQDLPYLVHRKKQKNPSQERRINEIQSNVMSLVIAAIIVVYIVISPAVFLNVAPNVDVFAHGVGFLIGLFGFWLFFYRDFTSKRNR